MYGCCSSLGCNSGNSLLLYSSIIITGSLTTEKGSYSGIAQYACSEKVWYANKEEAEDGLTINQAFIFFSWDVFISVDGTQEEHRFSTYGLPKKEQGEQRALTTSHNVSLSKALSTDEGNVTAT